MALVNRLSRLFKSDLHAVLDSIEEPQALLKQAIREMEEELSCGQQRIKNSQYEVEKLIQRRLQLQKSTEKLNEELEVCFQVNNDDLARSLIKRKLQSQRLLEGVVQQLISVEKQFSAQQAQLKENQMHFESMQQKAELLSEDPFQEASKSGEFEQFFSGFNVSEDEVEIALLQEKQRRQRQAQE